MNSIFASKYFSCVDSSQAKILAPSLSLLTCDRVQDQWCMELSKLQYYKSDVHKWFIQHIYSFLFNLIDIMNTGQISAIHKFVVKSANININLENATNMPIYWQEKPFLCGSTLSFLTFQYQFSRGSKKKSTNLVFFSFFFGEIR